MQKKGRVFMTEFQILSAVHNSGNSICYVDLLNQGLTDSRPDPCSDKLRIEELIAKGCLSGNLRSGERITLKAHGIALLDQLQQAEEEKNKIAKSDAKNKRDQVILSLFSAAAGAAFTLLAELLFTLLSA